MIRLNINGKPTGVDASPDTPLLWALRDQLGLTGAKYGCGQGLCGACTVLINGQPARACTTPISAVGAAPVSTIEATSADRVGAAVQNAWVKHDVVQCGYCQSGMVMTATALLKTKKNPSDAEIDSAFAGNLCRCGTYARVRAAVKDAARALA